MKIDVGDSYIINGNGYPKPVFDKYLDNIRKGRAQLGSGRITTFTGFESTHHDGITLRAFFDQSSQNEIAERIVKPIKQLAEESNVEIYSSNLWTPHISVADLRMNSDTTQNRDGTFENVASDPEVDSSLESLADMSVTFDTLIPGSAITLAASSIPDQIISVREAIKSVIERNEMKSKDFNNITHTTVARVAYVSPDSSTNVLGRGIHQLHIALVRNPIIAKIGFAELKTNEQFEKDNEWLLMAAVRANKRSH